MTFNRYPARPGATKRVRKNRQPEANLQVAVKQYLSLCLPYDGPDAIWWTASLAGHGKLTRYAQAKAKAMGLQRGWPDLQFLFPDGVVRFIELKAEKGTLTDEQKAFRDFARPHGIWAVCRSVDDVAAQLSAWGAKLRAHPFAAPAAVVGLGLEDAA